MNSLLKKLIVGCFVLSSMAFGACEDTVSMVGTTIQPSSDLITVYTDTFKMQASTVMMDSVFAKTSNAALGELYDPVFGLQKSDFIGQFYCEDSFKFRYTPYNGLIDSVALILFYNSWVGDSLTPMEATVYPVNKALTKNFYTNINPQEYCDMNNPLGHATYTAYDMSISDSIRNITSTSDANYYSAHVKVSLPKEIGQKFYDETLNNPSTFSNQNSFNDFFPGVYVTTTFGSGNILSIIESSMRIYYHYALKDTAGNDSIINVSEIFYITKEVVQMNRAKNSSIDQLLVDNGSCTYIKSPAGVCTKLVIPTTEIAKVLDVNDRYINNFTLNLHYLPADEWDFAYTPPANLLLIQEDSVKAFFENGSIENSKTTFISHNGSGTTSGVGLNTSYRMYYFGNVSSLLKDHIKTSPDKDLRLLIIPVVRETGTSSSYTSSPSYYTTDISNYLVPSGVKIRTDEDYMNIVVVSSKFENK